MTSKSKGFTAALNGTVNLDQKVTKYAIKEGGELRVPAGEGMTGREVVSLPLIDGIKRGFLWGYIHAFYLEDGTRLDAFNDMHLTIEG